MARAALRYVCQSCGAVSSRWAGQCSDCNEWNTIQQEAAPVGLGLVQGGVLYAAVPVLGLAGAVLYQLATPEARLAFRGLD